MTLGIFAYPERLKTPMTPKPASFVSSRFENKTQETSPKMNYAEAMIR